MKILSSITTGISGWQSKIKEIKQLKLKEVALFLTHLKHEERKELYRALKDSPVEKIPFVHIRSDMPLDELDYLVDNYHTEVFNTHSEKEYPFLYNLDKYKNILYIENAYDPMDERELRRFAGICLDFSHLENDRFFRPQKYQHNVALIEKYPIGCNHLSPSKNFATLNKQNDTWPEDPHVLKKLTELDYLASYPLKYFSKFMAMEMENSIERQLVAINYLNKEIFKSA